MEEKLLKIPYFKVAAVIFIGFGSLFLTNAIAGSLNNDSATSEEEEMIRRSSFVYASKDLNLAETIIEESYFDGSYFEDSNVVIQNSAFVANNSPTGALSTLSLERSGIITYEVQQGDIPSGIASMFGITTNTLLWANNLSPLSKIKAGQELIILPVSGIKHTVKNGETLDKIVKTYKGNSEETIAMNGLPANGNLAIGQDIIIPDGQKPVEYAPKAKIYAYSTEELGPYGSTSHGFPWGQCTWYVAQKKYVPWNGDAKTWLKKAVGYGFETGIEPRPGAIISMRGNTWIMKRYGHVAYVEAVNEDSITISDMNYLGLGIKSVRAISRNDWRILGYIY
ncbi:LysM peptidoglycan-binding domain-containing protein [Patescibacteria group bacterium]|nr:LysM peptidoglycan-binding domain-containing protein [Patescibacteria group bacterium]MBU4458882.1 LysM peptidoglycan-binding domain-containing protein [Patescibacteria group bacterium]MCG2696164.1 LysM peptidoglycan-binding domain-containing protein [Candidatus Portnoybacteria bacterium]